MRKFILAVALAVSLVGSVAVSSADAQWLFLLAQQVGLGLAQARLRERRSLAEQQFTEMSEAIEAQVEARLEQLTGRGR